MKIVVGKKDMLEVLGKIQGMTSRKSGLAITETVLIKAEGATLTLTATDLEGSFIGTYPAQVETEGTVAVNSRKLFEIFKEFPQEEILLQEEKNHWLHIGKDKVSFNILGMDETEFPTVADFRNAETFPVETSVLAAMVDNAAMVPPMADDSRPHVRGANLERRETEDGGVLMRMVSTDGHRLTLTDKQYEAGSLVPAGPDILIPKKGLADIGRFLNPAAAETVNAAVLDNHFVVETENEALSIRLLEGEYPDYRGILDKENGHFIHVDHGAFLHMIRRMSILSTENYRAVIFRFEPGKLTVSTANPELGESKEDLDVNYEGDTLEIAFNPKYFTDALNIIAEDQVILRIIDEESPCFVSGKTDTSFLCLIMPMRV